MEMIIIVVAVIFCAGFFFFAASGKSEPQAKKKDAPPETPIRPKRILTLNEQPMYNRLVEALPNHIVWAQVSFSALLTASGYVTRAKFNRKITDFVVLDKSFNVVAVVELDDRSHNGKEVQDAERDAMLNEAGYRVIRYNHTPDLEKLQADFFPQNKPENSNAQ